MDMSRLTPKRVALFRSRVDTSGDCHLWTGPVSSPGYGAVSMGKSGKTALIEYAHRIAFLLAFGVLPDDLHILHACGNKLCCNPDHLYAGTDADNMADQMRLHERPLGEDHHMSKLTCAAVEDIRTSPLSNRALADKYGVSHTTIWQVRVGKTWVS